MTTIPVLWLDLDLESIPRGYWDQGLLEQIFGGDVHRLRYEYEHHIVHGAEAWPDVRFGIVVLPGRFHPTLYAEVEQLLRRLEWVLLIVTSDEESLFPVERVHHARMRVWVQTPHPTKDYDPAVRFFPVTFKQDTTDQLRDSVGGPRSLDLYFSGQVTHERRTAMYAALERLADTTDLCIHGEATGGFAQSPGGRDEYLRLLSESKVIPCPSGPTCPDTFRWAEALEAHAVPLADGRSPGGPGVSSGYWHRIVGGDPPFPVIESWQDLEASATLPLQDWPRTANRIQAWWQRYKRQLVWLLESDIDGLLEAVPPSTLADLITVVIPTSPIHSHPSTAVIEETLDSLIQRLPGCEIVIAVDGVRPEQEELRPAYEEYVQRLLVLSAFRYPNVVPVLLSEWGHQANTTRAALQQVRTPLLLFVEHDCPLMGDTPFEELAQLILAGEANVVRLSHEASILEPYRHLMLDDQPRSVRGVPLTATIQWSQRPHLALTAFYRSMLGRYFGLESRTMIEDLMHGVVQRAHVDGGWGMFRLFIYTPEGDIKRSITTDGRGAEPKYDMWFTYDGDCPEWAPHPTGPPISQEEANALQTAAVVQPPDGDPVESRGGG